MNKRIAEIFEAATLAALKARVAAQSASRLRSPLLAEYERLFHYRNIEEWNALVRVCEALALVGWGEREPVEALAARWVNGSWYTTLQTREFRKLAGHGNTGRNTEAEWSKRGSSYILCNGDDERNYGIESFASQRLPLPKNPIRLGRRVANHQTSAAPFVDALSALRKRLDKQLSADRYGDAFEYVGIACVFSNHDDKHETVRGEFFHAQKDVPKGFKSRHYVRPRLGLGKLTQKNGLWHWRVDRHFTRAEGELPLPKQKQVFAEDLLSIVATLGQRLAKKKLSFDQERLRVDLEALLAKW